jgi:hypothetical protein
MTPKSSRTWIFRFLLVVVVISLAFLGAARFLVINNPQHSDLILVLAGETDHRPALALQLLDQGYAKQVLIDVPTQSKIYEYTQLQLAENYVQGLPQHAQISLCPIVGLSTQDESRDVKQCLANRDVRSILIVTSDFHTRRALSVFRRQIPQISYSIAAAHDDAQFGLEWWRHRQWAKVCFEEWLRFLWWNAVDRWRA